MRQIKKWLSGFVWLTCAQERLLVIEAKGEVIVKSQLKVQIFINQQIFPQAIILFINDFKGLVSSLNNVV